MARMKKWLVVAVALALAVCFAGCGGSQQASSSSSSNTQSTVSGGQGDSSSESKESSTTVAEEASADKVIVSDLDLAVVEKGKAGNTGATIYDYTITGRITNNNKETICATVGLGLYKITADKYGDKKG